MNEFISPIQFDKSFLTSIDFDIKEGPKHFNAPPSLNNLSHSLEVSHSRDYEDIEGMVSCQCVLAVKWKVEAQNEKGDYAPLFRANAEIMGWAKCPSRDHDPKEVQEVLAASNIGFLWAALRDYFDVLTGASVVGRILLPAISPYVLLEDDASKDEEGSKS